MLEQTEIPVYDADLFDPAALRAPFGHYQTLRDLGPVVRLADTGIYALPRFADVRDGLQAPDRLISGLGVGFSEAWNTIRPPNLIASDGELHRKLKATVMRPLLPAQLRQHRATLKELIVTRVLAVRGTGQFDAMAEIARFLPVTAISVFVGLPEEGRASMLEWAAATFNALGPERDGSGREASARDANLLGAAWRYMASLSRDKVREGSWAGALFDAADAGRITEAEARGAMSAYVIPSLDTTILAKGHLLLNLARNPDQWARLRQDPSLIPGAVLEGVRHSAVIRWFSRSAAGPYRVGAHVVPDGARVMMMYASANRDERQYPDPDRFDITRDASRHLAWGTGPHMCAGMHLARIEMEVMLEALVETCEALDAGEPELADNAGLYGFSRLPFALRPAG